MSKIRVYELARKLNIESKQLVNRILKMGIEISSHQSTLSPSQVENIEGAIKTGSSGKVEEKSASAAKPKVVRRRRKVIKTEEVDGAEITTEISEVVEIGSKKKTASVTEKKVAEPEPEQTEPAKESSVPPVVAAIEEESNPVVEPEKVAATAPKTVPETVATATVTTTTAATSETPKAASSEPKVVSRKVRIRDSLGGAKIVRKADPAEVAARKAAIAAQKAASTGQPSYSSDPDARVQSQSFVGGQEGTDFRGVRKKKVDTAEEERKKSASQKAQRGRASQQAQQMLRNLDTSALEDFDSKLEIAARRRTFTPSGLPRRADLKRRKNLKKTQITMPKAELRVVEMGENIKVGELAKQLSIKAGVLIKKLMTGGDMLTMNDYVDFDTATIVAEEFQYTVKSIQKSVGNIIGNEEELSNIAKVNRPPVVTVMGHVDHGKTSVLDAIRKADVVSGEAGGITQHIGAYTVKRGEQSICFLDTPGHEAFSAMRSRGAQTTDVVVLVIAADDGVMPQTIEAIQHAKAAKVPLLVAVNKIDKGEAGMDRIYTQLAEYGVQPEDWGGDTQFVKVSALKKIGLEELLDNILLLSEMQELQAREEGPAEGVILEANLDKGRGALATILVTAGTMKKGDFIVCGTKTGRVRAMYDHTGAELNEATPSTPVKVTGLEDVPMAGDSVHTVDSEKKARDIAKLRIEEDEKNAQIDKPKGMDALLAKMQEGDKIELPIIIKADTQGTAEAISESLVKLNTDAITNQIVMKSSGGISESDIRLAETTGAVIVGFQVRAGRGLAEVADNAGVTIKYFSVIYEIVDAIKSIMIGKLPTIKKEVVQGHAEVRNLISISRIGNIAGSAVLDGKITRHSKLRLIREDVVVYDGKLGSLKRFKDDAKEVATGFECGIMFESYNDIKVGDIIEAYTIEEEAATL